MPPHPHLTVLQVQLDKLRSEKRQLHAKTAGVDLAKIEEGDALVSQVKEEMEAVRKHYADMVSELQGKLKWYAENQQLLDRNEALVR